MFTKIADIIYPDSLGDAELDILELTENNIDFRSKMSGIIPGKYARLKVNGEIMMSETPMEQRTNGKFVLYAHGDILIGGLGLGMIILPIQDKESVNSITVIEKNQNVIDLVCRQLPFNNKVNVIHDDVFLYKPDSKYDCIYMDIWSYINSEIYKTEMIKLKRKYAHCLKPLSESPNRFNQCWCEYQAKRDQRLI